MRKCNIALGFYQELATADAVLEKLRKSRFQSYAFIHHKKNAGFKIRRHIPFLVYTIPIIGLLLVLTLFFFNFYDVPLISGITLLTLIGTFWSYSKVIKLEFLNRYKNLVIADEKLVIVNLYQDDVREVLGILRQVKSGHPVSFLLRTELVESEELDIPAEPLPIEQLREEAFHLSHVLKQTKIIKDTGQPLLKRLEKSNQLLQFLRHDIADAEFIEQTIPLSAEWLLDNMYVIEGSIEDVKRNLPKKYYKKLPKIGSGPLQGYPRIYAIAIELVKSTAGRLNRDNIVEFLTSYQKNDPLTIGELWALPLMLRLRLIEWIQFLAIHVDNRMREGELASFWGNRLLYAVRHEPTKLQSFIEELTLKQKSPSPHFAEELLEHLFDEEAVLPLVRKWLEDHFAQPLNEILHQEHLQETSEQIVFSSSVLSLITLSQLSWKEIFEIVSPIDEILRADPLGIYLQMDFTTRNNYREVIELIARYSEKSEIEIAKTTLNKAKVGVEEVEKHVGYYLIDKGRELLEKDVAYQPTFVQSIRRWITNHSAVVYLGGITLLITSIELFIFSLSPNLNYFFLFLALSIIPVMDLSIQIVHFILTLILPPIMLPKMHYEKNIPREYKTLVVVPTMLLKKDSINEEIDQLEIRYLGNTDPSLCFGLFSDFLDAPEQETKDDHALLEVAKNGIENLDKKYGPGKFFLFHRQRVWSNSENSWIGWERKRGKIEYLNRFLMGEKLPENIIYQGTPEGLNGIRYVITLDADTQLPKDQAKALIEILSHPLNRPYLSSDKKSIIRGYTIIQPRVVTDIDHARSSWFSKLFSEPSTVDPYTLAISNINQDLVGEGSFHGKGIYDLDAFYQILAHRFPEEHLLSHDLIEGSYVRSAFASNVCLYDMHPESYLACIKRKHRWMRGDWQIIDWLLPQVPCSNNQKEPNLLSWMNQWKIFDNLRRALLPVSLLLLLVAAWIFSLTPGIWTGLVTVVLFMPWISFCINKFINYSLGALKASLSDVHTGFLRTLITAATLPFEAYISIEALLCVIYRRCISHRNLLKWTASQAVNHHHQEHQQFIYKLGTISLLGVITFWVVDSVNPIANLYALPYCFLWFIAPAIISFIDKPLIKRSDQNISKNDRKMLREVARKTWGYFDEFVGPQTHWLPPDNFQELLRVEVAQRTSPTNIGMWLFSVMSAYDFKYINCDEAIDKAFNTLATFKKLEKYEGHLLNWYNIQTLDPLFPRYISTVDSGNLLACLWTLRQGINEITTLPVIPNDPLIGIRDTYEIFEQSNKLPNEIIDFHSSNYLPQFINKVTQALKEVEVLTLNINESEAEYWLKKLNNQLMSWETLILRYFSWVKILNSISTEDLKKIHKNAISWKENALTLKPSLNMLIDDHFLTHFNLLIEHSQDNHLPTEIKAWGKKLSEALSKTQWLAREKMNQVEELINEIDLFSQEMNLQYLYNNERKLFAIGYNVDSKKMDNSFYDLLASESRIASLASIAYENAPLEHWWALGRFYSIVEGRKVLLSWGGTMFEYLMPLLFNKPYPDSLLGEACAAVVACQIEYGRRRGIPWGISESAYSAIDSHRIYQYKSFGIPGLGLKRGLEEDLVVSPYSSGLALAVDPLSAIKNLRNLTKMNMMGRYGYYESIDFTRQKSPTGERGVIVYAYMAHHQGMFLSAINNLLNNDVLVKRFHNEPCIAGVNSLLYERIPYSPAIKVSGIRKEATLTRLKPFSQSPVMGVVETPQSVTPKINLLSNEVYSVMVSNTGGGYSRWKDIDISRWRSDTTKDDWGSFCYIKDMKTGAIWSATYQPTQYSEKTYSVNFKEDKAEFRRKDHNIETFSEVVVSPEDSAEIRLITLINHSKEIRYLELTSYMELALAPHLTDRAHPCFNKLFIETEALPEHGGLLAFRRLRSPDDNPVWAAHVVASSQPLIDLVQYETDRSKFIGRGKSLKHPLALQGDLTNTTGTVLDPIFSLRQRVKIEPGRRIQLSFITGAAENRTSATALIMKYKDLNASIRVLELAWAYAQLEIRHLRIHQEEVQLFQKLASRILYPHSQLRIVQERLKKNNLGQSGLWSQGISGDLPIVVVTVGDLYDIDLVKQVLVAHAFWGLRGLKVDLVILNEEETGYFHPLQEELQNLIQAYSHRTQIEMPGGVYLRIIDQIPPEVLNLILCVARAILIAARGSLRQQLVSPKSKLSYPPKLHINKKAHEQLSRPLPFIELPYFNGLGGYTQDGHEYVIYLGPHTATPAPWINVIANPQFGTLVSESGLGCTWYGNSQTNRLTPWSNDPILDPVSDAIYIRDEELGTFWTPTPAPIRELDAYRTTHGQGYTRFEHNSHGIEQELLVFVPVNDADGLPLRIQRLKLLNKSSRKRYLSVTAYSEWVLGNDKEETQLHVFTEWDSESQSLFAYNRYHPDFSTHLAFASSIVPATSFTGDRTEFLGRNRSANYPEALKRKALSGHTGAGLDPCAALQSMVAIDIDQEIEVIFILGYTTDAISARQLILQCRNPGKIDQLFKETQEWWNRTLGTIQIDVPDKATNFAMNRWLLYQNLSCRFWGRSGFYQSSGAYGFRDQLQDVMSLVYTLPNLSRDYILKAASRQFIEGDVQHWWHPQSGGGIRTRFSDDLLWLPFVTAHYVRVTGDASILEEIIPFLEAPTLEEHQHEVYQIPTLSKESGTLLEHCRRALKKGITKGPQGLPLIGCGDWNDGMNRVGIDGKGESVWLAWFLIHVMNDFAYLIQARGNQEESGEGYRIEAKRLAEVIENTAWDGAWYRRAYYDDGTPIGSQMNSEAMIDSLAQSWSIISGLGNPERSAIALQSALEHLVKESHKIVLLLTPPFDKTVHDPGYIKGYPPGVRENGGQYTHGSSWLAMAFARVGNGTKAAELLRMMAPNLHTQNPEANSLYKVEPYVIAADIYDLKGQIGRGGWTWYTGSASWIYRIWLEEILGFKLRGNKLSIECAIPKDWPGFKINYLYLSSAYEIQVNKGENENILLDGLPLTTSEITLVDDGQPHKIEITIT